MEIQTESTLPVLTCPPDQLGPRPALNDSLHMSIVAASCHVSGLEKDPTVKEKFEIPGLNGLRPLPA